MCTSYTGKMRHSLLLLCWQGVTWRPAFVHESKLPPQAIFQMVSDTYTCLGQIFQTAQNRCWKLACVHITFHWNIKTFFIKKNMLKVIDLLHIESDSFFLVVELLKSLDVAFYRGHLWACVKEPGELWLNCENIGCNLPRWHLGKLKKLSVPQRAGVTCAHWSDMWQVCVFFGNRKLICFLLVRWMRTCLKASN